MATQGPSNKHGDDRWQGSAQESAESRKPKEGKRRMVRGGKRATHGSRRGSIEVLGGGNHSEEQRRTRKEPTERQAENRGGGSAR